MTIVLMLVLVMVLCGLSRAQTAVFNGNTVVNGNTLIPAPQSTPPPIGTLLFTLEQHSISDPNAYPTIPFGGYRDFGTSCQWNTMWTGTGDTYNFACFGQQITYANSFGVPLMFTFGQVPSGLSTINPDNAPGAPAQFPVTINGVTIACGSGTCSATVSTLQRMNAAVGDSVTLVNSTGCPESPNGTFTLTAANNPTDYPGWTYTFGIGAGSTSSSGCGGTTMTLADNAQTATRCSGTGTAPGGQNGGCYAPNDLTITGGGSDTHLISFLNQLLTYDAANDPNHVLKYIEVWNEPQGAGFFNGSIAQMARMTKDMSAVIGASAQSSYLQLASVAPSGGLTSPANYLALYGADPSNPFQYVCCIDSHTYNYPPGQGTPDPMSAITILANVRAAIAPFPSAQGKPFLATEGSYGFGPFGASTTNQGPNTGTAAGGDKSGWVVDGYMAHQCAGYSMFSFFAWDQKCGTGLACATPPPPYSISPAGVAYGIAHDWLVGATVAQSCTKDSAGNWTLKLQRGTYNATALWNACLTTTGCTLGTYTIIPGVFTDYRDIFGNINGITPTQTTVPVQFDPILMETSLPPFNITTSATLPSATIGVPYTATLSATSAGASPYTWKEVNIPSVLTSIGLTLNSASGLIVKVSGTPTATGTFATQVRVQDANGVSFAQNISITVNPAPLVLNVASPPNGQQGTAYGPGGAGYTFSATGGVQCSGGHYNWSNIGVAVPGLSINATTGNFGGTPTTPGNYAINIQVQDCNIPTPTTLATGPITINIAASISTLTVLTTTCPNGTIGAAYNCTIQFTGGTSPYTCSLTSGTLPAGTALTTVASTCVISGGALTGSPATYNPLLLVTDSTLPTHMTAPAPPPPAPSYVIVVSGTPPTNRDNVYTPFSGGACVPTYGASSDGPALTPTRCQNSQRINRPSPGATVVVAPGANLQTALNAAACGQIIKLTAGATYGHVVFPALNCSITNWLTITTTSSSSLPPEGTRVTPCQIGLASIPGRPTYSCPTPANLMGSIQNTASGNLFDMSVNPVSFVQFIGVNFANACTAPCQGSTSLAVLGSSSHDIVFDQVVMNGIEGVFPATATTRQETQRGIALGQSNNVMVVDSYFYNFYCLSTVGACGDSQAISGGVGTVAGTLWGNYKIVNNFLEGAAETFEFGGGAGPGANPCQPSCVDDSPADLEVRLNHMFKPPQWEPPLGSASPSGFPTVKNHFECKNCERAFVEGNIMEGLWPGFSQNGVFVLLTPKNQQIGTAGVCPNCSVHDVIVRYNLAHGGINFLQTANGLSDPPALAAAFQGFGYSIHDNIADNLLNPAACWGSAAAFCAGEVTYQVSEDIGLSVTSDILHNISIIHNTTVVASTASPQPAGLLGLSGQTAASGFGINNITFNNNLGSQATSGTINVVGGGKAQCAFGPTPGINTITACWGTFPPSTFTGNDIVQSTAIWGSGQCLSEPTYTSIFVNYNNGLNGDYHVKPTSPCLSFGSGANVDLVNSNTAGVQ